LGGVSGSGRRAWWDGIQIVGCLTATIQLALLSWKLTDEGEPCACVEAL
jgi:hypothetical protein